MAFLIAGVRHRSVAAALLMCLALLSVPVAAHAASTDQAVAYQLDPAHDGYQTADPITTPLKQAWSDSLPGAVSYPLIVNGVVYVTASVSSGYGTTLYAIEQATGATLWSRALGGTYFFSGLAYDAGQVFTVNFDGQLTAFNASTGARDWSVALPGQSSFTSPPTAANGFVYVGGAGGGGTLYAVSEASGAIAWMASVENGDHSSPAVSSTGVYVSYACDQDYDFNPLTGSRIWHYAGNCEGGGGTTPVLANGEVFGRDSVSGNVVLSASDGSLLGAFSSSQAPAAGGGELYASSTGILSALGDWGLGSAGWSFGGGATNVDTAPLLDGSLIFEGSASGELYAVDATTGTTTWSTNVGAAISAPDEQNAVSLTGLGVGENTLIVPAGSALFAYTGANVGGGIPANDLAPSVSGTPVASEAVGADVGVWSALPTGYSYQWSLCDAAGENCATISAAGTGESYTPTLSDGGDTLEVTVTATNASGTSNPVTSAASSQIPERAPTNQTLPSISGAAQVGQTLTASSGTWANNPTSYGYQWLRCQPACAAIGGATASTYAVSGADVMGALEVEVTAHNFGGATAATSPATATIPTPTALAPASSPSPSAPGASVTFTAAAPASRQPPPRLATVDVVIRGKPSRANRNPTVRYTETGTIISSACTIDGRGTPCGSTSAKLAKLSSGHHTFRVTVSGGGMNTSAHVSWVIAARPPAAGSTSKRPVTHPAKPAAQPKKKTKRHRSPRQEAKQ